MRLVHEVDSKHIPLAAELAGEGAPRLLDTLLCHSLVIPQPFAWPRIGLEAVASHQDQDPVLRGHLRGGEGRRGEARRGEGRRGQK